MKVDCCDENIVNPEYLKIKQKQKQKLQALLSKHRARGLGETRLGSTVKCLHLFHPQYISSTPQEKNPQPGNGHLGASV